MKTTGIPLINFGDSNFKFKELTEIVITEDISKLNTLQSEPKFIYPIIRTADDASSLPDKINKFLKKQKYKGAIITSVELNTSEVKNKIIRLNKTANTMSSFSKNGSIFNCHINNKIITPITFAVILAKQNNTNEIFIKDPCLKNELHPVERRFIIDLFYSRFAVVEISDKKSRTTFLPRMSCKTAEKYILFNK